MSYLLREHAPISEAAWRVVEHEARSRLTPALAARKLVDFAGPHGREHSATNLGRAQPLEDAPADGVFGAQHRLLALTELRVPFSVDLEELRDVTRVSRQPSVAVTRSSSTRVRTSPSATSALTRRASIFI